MGDLFGKDRQTPPAPDYRGAAEATATGNLEATRYATKANRVNQYTPYGSLTYTQGGATSAGPINWNGRTWNSAGEIKQFLEDDYRQKSGGLDPSQEAVQKSIQSALSGIPGVTPGDPDQWTQTINLSPVGQGLLDRQNQTSMYLGDQAIAGLQRVGHGLAQPFDVGSIDKLADKAYGAYTARLDPLWQKNEEALRTRLANSGIPVGSEAWNAEMKSLNEGRTDAYQQANTGAIATMPQTYQLAAALRSQPLNELNALRTGAQVTNPSFNQVPQQQTTTGANYLGASQAQGQWDMGAFNAQQASDNAAMQGLFSIGAAAAGSPWAAAAFKR